MKNQIAKVGMQCTEYLFSDYYGGKIVEASKNGKRIKVHFYLPPKDKFDYEYPADEPLPEIPFHVREYSLRKSGAWRQVGSPDKPGNCYLCLGRAVYHYDREF